MNSLDSEQAVVGCVLLDNAAMSDVSFLDLRDFFFSRTRICFEAARHLVEHGHPVDYLTLGDRLKATGALDDAGGVEAITLLTDCVPSAVNVREYALRVKELSRRRDMQAKLTEAGRMLLAGDEIADVATVASEAVDLSFQGGGSVTTIGDAFELYEEYQSGSRAGFLLTGFDAMDVCAPSPSELVVLAARQSVGKTAFAVALADKISKRGDPVAFFSIEMSGEELQLRRVAGEASVSMVRLRERAGVNTPAAIDSVVSAFGAMNERPLEVYSGSYSMGELVTNIRNLKARRGVKAVFIDHLGLVNLDRAERRDIAVGNATRQLARTCKDIGVTVFLLVQLNRNAKAGSDGKLPPPRMGDLRDSGRIAEDADGVWLLDRPGYYDEDDNSGDFHVLVAKNRNGPIRNIVLGFDKETGRFTDRSY